jgi:hypothetical protein
MDVTAMTEVTGNIWDYLGKAVIAITTNGRVTRAGKATLGYGCARQAGALFPDLPLRLGQVLREQGNHVNCLGDGLVSFPVEETPWSAPDLALIARSARELRDLADRSGWTMVVVPRPGCGGGGLAWHEVKPAVEEYFDDRFHVITTGKQY